MSACCFASPHCYNVEKWSNEGKREKSNQWCIYFISFHMHCFSIWHWLLTGMIVNLQVHNLKSQFETSIIFFYLPRVLLTMYVEQQLVCAVWLDWKICLFCPLSPCVLHILSSCLHWCTDRLINQIITVIYMPHLTSFGNQSWIILGGLHLDVEVHKVRVKHTKRVWQLYILSISWGLHELRIDHSRGYKPMRCWPSLAFCCVKHLTAYVASAFVLIFERYSCLYNRCLGNLCLCLSWFAIVVSWACLLES